MHFNETICHKYHTVHYEYGNITCRSIGDDPEFISRIPGSWGAHPKWTSNDIVYIHADHLRAISVDRGPLGP